METEEELNEEHKFLVPIFVVGGILLISALFYAIWNIVNAAASTNVIKTGCFATTYKEKSNIINLVDIRPISDEDGLKNSGYTFTIDNTCSINASYELLLGIENSNIPLDNIKVSINGEEPIILDNLSNKDISISGIKENKILKQGSLTSGENTIYSIKMWIDENYKTNINDTKLFNGKIIVTNYTQ